MARFNGHKNWNHWNVSLWINNDEELYRTALFYVGHYREARGQGLTGRDRAVNAMMDYFRARNITNTPDGAPYSKTAIRAAMRGM